MEYLINYGILKISAVSGFKFICLVGRARAKTKIEPTVISA